MTRPLRRPGYPWPGQFGLGPQTVDEIVRRLNERPSGPPPRQQLGIRWVRPISDEEFQGLVDDSIVGPSEENRLFIAQEQRLSGDEVNGYCPSMWVHWVETDTEDDGQDDYDLDIHFNAFKVYFPMYSWMRSSNATLQANRVRLINRLMSAFGGSLNPGDFGLRTRARFPVFFNPRTGNWEAIALTETLPDHFIGVYDDFSDGPHILPAEYNSTDSEWRMGYGYVQPLVNKELDYPFHTSPPTTADGITSEYIDDLPMLVMNWTEMPIVRGVAHLYWLDMSSGFYLVVKQLDMFTVTIPTTPWNDVVGLEHADTRPINMEGTTFSIDVYNPGEFIHAGAEANVMWSYSNKRFEVIQAFSATKIRATINATSPGSSRPYSELVSPFGLDGHLSSSTLRVHVPSDYHDVVTRSTGNKIICDLEWTGTETRWVVTSVLNP